MATKIKSITVKRHDYVFSDLSSDSLEIREINYRFTLFDESGNPLKEINYSPDGGIEEIVERDFVNNLPVEERYFDQEEELVERKTFTYCNKGIIETETKHYLDGSEDITAFIYDDDGKLIKKILKDEEEVVEQSDYFHYAGKYLTLHEAFDSDNNLVKKYTYKYDTVGNIIESTVFDDNAGENYQIVNEFNAEGQRIKFVKYDHNQNPLEEVAYEYDNRGNITKIAEVAPMVKNTTFLEYDAEDNLIKQEEYNHSQQLNHRIEREYDNNNNITGSRVFIDYHGEGLNRNYLLEYVYEYFTGE